MKTLLRMGHPVLLKSAQPVSEFGTPWLKDLIREMWEAMHSDNGVGLAAPQIGESVRVIVLAYPDPNNKRGVPPIPPTVLINPVITPIGVDMEEAWESCLSVPGMTGKVPRYLRVRYCGFDIDGCQLSQEASGFHARILQHECDHLDGILYPARILHTKAFGFADEIQLAKDEGLL